MERHIWTDFHPDCLNMDSRYRVDPMRSSDVDPEWWNKTWNMGTAPNKPKEYPNSATQSGGESTRELGDKCREQLGKPSDYLLWSNRRGGTLVKPWWNIGATLAEPWWNLPGNLLAAQDGSAPENNIESKSNSASKPLQWPQSYCCWGKTWWKGGDITMTPPLQKPMKRETVPQSSTARASVNPGFHHPSPKSFPSKLLARQQMLRACHHSGVMVTTNHSPRNWVEHPGVSPGGFSVRGFGVEGSRMGSILSWSQCQQIV